MKIDSEKFLKVVAMLFIFSVLGAKIPGKLDFEKARVAKVKSRLKQIGTTVAMYYAGEETKHYPQNPSVFEFDEDLLRTSKVSNWLDLNLNSPYFFFPSTGGKYTEGENKPLAINWEPFKVSPHYAIVYEDGHVGSISDEEAYKLMNSSLKNSVSFILYKLLAKKNEAL